MHGAGWQTVGMQYAQPRRRSGVPGTLMVVFGIILVLLAAIVLMWAALIGYGAQELQRVTAEPVAIAKHSSTFTDKYDRLYLPDGVTPDAVDQAVGTCTFTDADGNEIELWWQRSPMFGPPSVDVDGAKYRGTLRLDFADDRNHWISCAPEAGEVYLRSKQSLFSSPWTVGAGAGLVGGVALAAFGIRSLRRR